MKKIIIKNLEIYRLSKLNKEKKIEKNNNASIIVDLHKKVGRNVSNFLLAMNYNENLTKYLAILIIYKLIYLWYNISRSGTHGPIRVSTKLKKHNGHLFAAKYQSYGINHAQSISCYAFLYLF